MDNDCRSEIQNEQNHMEGDFSLSRQCQYLNQEMTDTVNAYKQEVINFYNNFGTEENRFQSATQMEWYQHFLKKKRLNSRNIFTHYEFIYPTRFPNLENKEFPSYFYRHDGKNMICTVKDLIAYRNIWQRDGINIFVDEPVAKVAYYNVIESKSVQGNCICPNCGHEDTLQNMRNGCASCGSKFQMEEFRGRVSSCYLKDNVVTAKAGHPVLAIILAVIVAYALMIVIILTNAPGKDRFRDVFPSTMAVCVTIPILKLIGDKKRAKKGIEAKDRLHEIGASFSEEYFIGSLMSKLSCIHYAEDFSQVQSFFLREKPYYVDYSNVVDCRMEHYLIEGHLEDSKYQYIDVSVSLRLIRDTNRGLQEEIENLRLRLKKSAYAMTHEAKDILTCHCSSCGASISFLHGAYCESCGNRISLVDFDWVIEDYMVIQRNSLDE